MHVTTPTQTKFSAPMINGVNFPASHTLSTVLWLVERAETPEALRPISLLFQFDISALCTLFLHTFTFKVRSK